MGVPSLHSLISASIRSISQIAASNAAFTLASSVSSAAEAVSSVSVPMTTLFLLNTSATEDMDFDDRLPFFPARSVYHNMPVEPSRPQKGGIQHVRPVCCGKDYHFFMGIKSVHFAQKLVQCLFPFIMAASKPCTACAAYGINLIYENNAWPFAFLNISLTREAPTPTNISMNSEALML